MSCALAGKHRHKVNVNVHHLAVRGSKTGLVKRRPSAFCCKVAARCLMMRGQHAPPTPPVLCGRGFAATASV